MGWHGLCYTDGMPDTKRWLNWAQFLQHWSLKEPVAALIEAAGPLSIFLAQFIYLGEPFLHWAAPEAKWKELAKTLEDKEDRNTFVAFLREEEKP
jgi:hypothetical protein